MKPPSPRTRFVLLFLLATAALFLNAEEPSAAALRAFNQYVQRIEPSLDSLTPSNPKELAIERVNRPEEAALPGAMLHHWRGTVFVPGATAADFERMLRNYAGYPQVYAPEVLAARQTSGQGNHLQASLRVRQKHVLTVVMDTDYDVWFLHPAAHRLVSIARSTRVAEMDGAGTSHEHALPPAEEHGFLWRQNTYWSATERDGGLALQLDSITRTRAIPRGLGWAVAPLVESLPRHSLAFTLEATRRALEKR